MSWEYRRTWLPLHTTTGRCWHRLARFSERFKLNMRQKCVHSTRGSVHPTKQDGVVSKFLANRKKGLCREIDPVQERIKEHGRDSQFSHIKTSAEWKAYISRKGERGRGPVDSRAVYTREIIGSLNNTRTFIRDLRGPRFRKPKVLSRTHINGPIPVLCKPRLMLAIDDFFS